MGLQAPNRFVSHRARSLFVVMHLLHMLVFTLANFDKRPRVRACFPNQAGLRGNVLVRRFFHCQNMESVGPSAMRDAAGDGDRMRACPRRGRRPVRDFRRWEAPTEAALRLQPCLGRDADRSRMFKH
jgi:hypothetical protein